MPKHHELKIDRPHWRDVYERRKPFEIRFNDRNYRKGDTISFKRNHTWGTKGKALPGTYRITYVLSGYGLMDGFVALGLRRIISSKG